MPARPRENLQYKGTHTGTGWWQAKRSGAPAWLVIGMKQGSKHSPGPGTGALGHSGTHNHIVISVGRLVLISPTHFHN